MGRPLRTDIGDHVYHVLNRANARITIFENEDDYELFEEVLLQAKERTEMRILAYCIMPNHWHMVVYPKKDGDLSRFVNWLTLTHTQRNHALKKTIGHGHLYQGRYKSFLVQEDDHLLSVIRYVERNSKRANLVPRAEKWQWSSVWRREYGTEKQKKLLSKWPIDKPTDYLSFLNEPQTAAEEETIRRSIQKGIPYGKDKWVDDMVDTYNLIQTTRGKGRPKKGS
jgi:putative transposase